MAAVFPSLLFAKATRFDFRDVGGRNLVSFVSDALLEKTVGLSSSVGGWIEVDLENLAGPIKGELFMDTRTFQTLIDSRNELVREKLAAENPLATFIPLKVKKSSKKILNDREAMTLQMEGTLSIRGVSLPQNVEAKLTYLKETEVTKRRLLGNLLKVSARFEIDPAQFQVTVAPIQQPFFASKIQLTVDLFGSDLSPSPSLGDVLIKPSASPREPTSQK